MQTFEVLDETLDEVFNTMLSLEDSISFFFGKFLAVFIFVGVWHDSEPDVDYRNREGNREIEHENG